VAKRPAKCPQCGKELEYESAVAGSIVCPNCHATLKAPGQVVPRPRPGDPLIGQSLGEFEIVELLGRGGMGAVYKAQQASLDRLVALKVLPKRLAADASFVERFSREARSAAAVRHPNIIEVYAVGEDKGHQFIAMEFIDGENLSDTLKREGKLAPDRAIEVMRQTASALADAHESGILHRDIKPANILIDTKGRVKVADFGLAKQVGVDVSVTATGAALGTPLYMPPEAAQGQPLDPRSDLYSLGAAFYRALAGKPPFDGATPAELAVKHVTTQVPPLQQLAPDVPPALCRIVHRLLRKNPAERYESAEKLIEALDRVEGRLGGGAPVSRVGVVGGTSASRADASAGTRTAPPASRAATRRQPTGRHGGGGPNKKRIAFIASTAFLTLFLILLLIPWGKQSPRRAAVPSPPPASRVPRPASPAAASAALERNAAVVFKNIQTCIGKNDWKKAEAYLARLQSKYGKTKFVAAHRSDIATFRKQFDTALAPTPQPPKPAPPKPKPPQPKPVRPVNTKFDLPPDGDPRWVRLLPSPTKPVGWRLPSKGATYADGVVELTGRAGIQHEIEARDMIIRAKVAKLAGKNLTVGLRHASGDNVKAWFNGGNFFGINRRRNGKTRDLATGHSKRSYAKGEFVDVALGSRGGRLAVWVAGERIIDVQDALAGPVSPVLTVFGNGRARFKEVRVLVFDNGWTAPVVCKPKPVAWKVYTKWPFDAAEAKRRQSETAKALGVPVEQEIEVKDGVKLTLVLIPAGEFIMGTAKDTKGLSRKGPEHPQHRVRLTRPFWLGKFEVTQEQWLVLMGRNPNGYPCGRNRLAARFLTWQNCRGWFARLAKRHAGREFRFPTEAEWEYACRAGAATLYPFGDDKEALGEYAWTSDPGKQQPVGQKRPNAWGLHDMLGNVQEWCYDRYGVYDARDQTDPTGPGGRGQRVRRVGSRPARRERLAETSADNRLGFRAAMSVRVP